MIASILAWFTVEHLWLALGFFAQALFAGRFIVQWLASEKAKASVVPVGFWYFSLFGGLLLLLYAIHRRDPVFVLGQLTGTLIYARNLYLIHRTRHDPERALSETEASSGIEAAEDAKTGR